MKIYQLLLPVVSLPCGVNPYSQHTEKYAKTCFRRENDAVVSGRYGFPTGFI